MQLFLSSNLYREKDKKETNLTLDWSLSGAVQRAVRERGGDVRVDPQLQRVLRRERRQQAGARVSPSSQRNHLRF
jgi:hypothetical protein